MTAELWYLWVDWERGLFSLEAAEGFECVLFGTQQRLQENLLLLEHHGFVRQESAA